MRDLIVNLPFGAYLVTAWDFAFSRVGMTLIAALIAFATGYGLARDSARNADLKDRIAALEIDLAIAKGAAGLEWDQTLALDTQVQRQKEQIDALRADLAKRAAARDRCRLDESDARRLRELR